MIRTSLFTASLILAASTAFAGSGHDHGHSHGGQKHSHAEAMQLDKRGAITAASKAVSVLIEQGQEVEGSPLDAAWTTTASENKTISKEGDGYYIVRFAGKDEKNLYILLSGSGELYDAKYSGQFDGLK